MILSRFASRLSGRSPIPEHILQASRTRVAKWLKRAILLWRGVLQLPQGLIIFCG